VWLIGGLNCLVLFWENRVCNRVFERILETNRQTNKLTNKQTDEQTDGQHQRVLHNPMRHRKLSKSYDCKLLRYCNNTRVTDLHNFRILVYLGRIAIFRIHWYLTFPNAVMYRKYYGIWNLYHRFNDARVSSSCCYDERRVLVRVTLRGIERAQFSDDVWMTSARCQV